MVEAQHKDQAAADIGYSTVVWDRRIDDVMAKDARARVAEKECHFSSS